MTGGAVGGGSVGGAEVATTTVGETDPILGLDWSGPQPATVTAAATTMNAFFHIRISRLDVPGGSVRTVKE
jgi:hypothetical protein